MLSVFLYVEERDRWSWYETRVSAELVYPPVSRVGMCVATLEDPLAVVACVMWAVDRNALE